MEKSVPLPLLSVVPAEPVNEPLAVSEVVFPLPLVVPDEPVNAGVVYSVSFLLPTKELETVPASVHYNKIDGSLSRPAYSLIARLEESNRDVTFCPARIPMSYVSSARGK